MMAKSSPTTALLTTFQGLSLAFKALHELALPGLISLDLFPY